MEAPFGPQPRSLRNVGAGQVLYGRHCYVVIEEVQGGNAFKLYNPWGLDSGNEREIPFTDLRGSIDRIYIH